MHEADIHFLADASYVVLAVFVLLLAKVALELLTPFDIDDEVSDKDNPAFGLSLVGYYLGVLIVYLGAVYHDPSLSEEGGEVIASHFLADLAVDGLWAVAAVFLLNATRILLDVVVLRGFSSRKEIVEDRNAGVGAVEFGSYLASALVVAAAISGSGGGWHTTVAFLSLGLVTLTAFALAYRQLLDYDLLSELEADNVAAGVAYGGNIIAMGVVLLRAIGGDFVSWTEHLERFGGYVAMGVVILFLGRKLINLAFLGGRSLRDEIAQDQNLNAGFLEGGLLLGFASIVAFAT